MHLPFDMKDWIRLSFFRTCSGLYPGCLLVSILLGVDEGLSQSTVRIDPGINLSDTAVVVLKEILVEAGVSRARVTSAYRSPENQVRVMYGYIRRHGVAAARGLYGPEGQAVIGAYERAGGLSEDVIRKEMLAELYRQLPSAFANKRLMHLHPCFYTFDVARSSIPSTRSRLFLEAARRHPRIRRVLGPDEGEKEAFHIEVEKTGGCTLPTAP